MSLPVVENGSGSKPGPTVAVIIPTLNEEATLPRLLTTLMPRLEKGDELFVVDGGSSDQTCEIAKRFQAEVISSEKGRGLQMNQGAKRSHATALWFLHADSSVSSDWRDRVTDALKNPKVVGGGFRVQIDASGLPYRLLDFWGRLRCGLLGTFYGDQGIFIRAEAFKQLGGFQEWPILEDLQLSKRMRRLGRLKLVQATIGTSARRWESRGWWRTVLFHSRLILLYPLYVRRFRKVNPI